jgi:cyclohexanone monooxygenase/acetone monooxygenase
MTTCLSQQTEWISDAIRHVREQGKQTIEPTKEGEDAWVAHHEETSGATLIAQRAAPARSVASSRRRSMTLRT